MREPSFREVVEAIGRLGQEVEQLKKRMETEHGAAREILERIEKLEREAARQA